MQKIYTLIVLNQVPVSLDDDINKLKLWFRDFAGLDLEVDTVVTDLPLAFKKYWENHPTAGELWGLDGIKQQLRDLKIIQPYAYHVICFFYDEAAAEGKPLGAFAYPNPLEGATFTAIPAKESWDAIDGMFRMASHEYIHCMHRWLWMKGLNSLDDMDKYDKEHEPYAEDGNRARNLFRIKPYYAFFDTPKYRVVAGQLIVALKRLAELYKKLLQPRQDRMYLWAQAIEKYENMDKSYNNPGALRFSPFQAGQRNGFSFFSTYDAGWTALMHQLLIAVDGRSQFYNPDMSILEFFGVYAPTSDGNEPIAYANFVARYIGVDPQTKIKELDGKTYS